MPPFMRRHAPTADLHSAIFRTRTSRIDTISSKLKQKVRNSICERSWSMLRRRSRSPLSYLQLPSHVCYLVYLVDYDWSVCCLCCVILPLSRLPSAPDGYDPALVLEVVDLRQPLFRVNQSTILLHPKNELRYLSS